MSKSALFALSPVDGRYLSRTAVLRDYFSEFALIRYRLRVEIEYFIALVRLPLPQLGLFPKERFPDIRGLVSEFSESEALRVKEIEKTTNHDVKAVEYYLREKWEELGIGAFREFIHFGLTSQDVNNTAVPLSLKEACEQVLFPKLQDLILKLNVLAGEWMDIPLLAHTHGQPASPTRLGKEVLVFSERLQKQIATLGQIPFAAKFGGATGNFNAHCVAYPAVDWAGFADAFVNHTLGLERSACTTQIEHYDFLAAWCDNLSRIHTILIDLDRDFWTYISMDYFKQAVVKGEVGSSAMPHKVNPIDFENSEGNLGLANALLNHLSAKLPISRLQRDLTDSTVLRNLGVPLAHSLIAIDSTLKGLGKLRVNEEKIKHDLNRNWAVLAEAVQTILRRENYPDPYNALKSLTRTGGTIDQDSLLNFISDLNVSHEVKEELKRLKPNNYLGLRPAGNDLTEGTA